MGTHKWCKSLNFLIMGKNLSKDHCKNVPNLKPGQTFHIKALKPNRRKVDLVMQHECLLGRGAFGVVNKMAVISKGKCERMTAVKIPEGDGELAIVELYLLLKLRHVNIAKLLYYFAGLKGMRKSIILVLEFVPGGDLFHYLKAHYSKIRGIGMMLEVFSYQMFRGLAYCHSHRVCHRDIKPENLLVDPESGILKITDFGCGAEMRHPKDTHTFYIGTRIFRAPELLLGAVNYDLKCDVWSGGVVMSEMALGLPIFYERQDNGTKGQLLKIFEYLGLPRSVDFKAMQVEQIPLPSHTHVAKKSIVQRFKMHSMHHEPQLVNLLTRIFIYSPAERVSSWEACGSDYFQCLRKYHKLPSGKPVPDLFNFTQHEIKSMPPVIRQRLVLS